MRQHVLFFPAVAMLISWSAIVGQTANSQQVVVKRPSTQWTPHDERLLLAKARQGDASSQMWLGAAYEQGWFGNSNFPQALKWFRRAAQQGDPDAQNSLGQMYENGEGVSQNYVLAAKWYRRAAEHVPDLGGAGQARNNLGMLYWEGRGVPKDYVQAYMWFSLSGSPNLAYARKRMTPAQILEAEQLVAAWQTRHGMLK